MNIQIIEEQEEQALKVLNNYWRQQIGNIRFEPATRIMEIYDCNNVAKGIRVVLYLENGRTRTMIVTKSLLDNLLQ